MIYMTVLARLYINFVTGINLESSLWVNFLGISLPFLGSCSLWFTYCSVLFHFLLDSLDFTALFSTIFSSFLYLSRSSWLLLSLLILALDSSLSSSFFEKFHQLRYESALDGAERQKNLASFRLWPPCCATPSSSSSSCVRAREQYR